MIQNDLQPFVEGSSDLIEATFSTDKSFQPENSPFNTLIVDITHRCNMKCKNCYIPNRTIPDMNQDWLYDILERLPRRTRIRLVGAEPTMRSDLPQMIHRIRKIGHLPILLSNGLKLANRAYLQELKDAGLRILYLSMNGGLDDAMYLAIDEMACAKKKLAALDNACDLNLYVSLGMILVRDLNGPQIGQMFDHIKNRRQVRELNLRSVGQFGRYMHLKPYDIGELERLFFQQITCEPTALSKMDRHDSHITFNLGRLQIQFTQWPDLNSSRRGRLAPDGTIHPFFEHVLANEGGY